MMSKIRNSANLLRSTILLIVLCSVSCDKVKEEPEQPTLLLTSISPTNGPEGTLVTIEGKGFGTDAGSLQVFFNELEAQVDSVADKTIIVGVPEGATTGNVKVVKNGKDSQGPVFTVLPEALLVSSISPSSGPEGTLVAINGEGFGADVSLVQVFFNEKEAIVNSVQDQKIEAEVPVGATSGKIKVVKDGKEFEGPEFTVSGVDVDGRISVIAGYGGGFADGSGRDALFNDPTGVAVDAEGNIYIGDQFNRRVRKITPAGDVTTVAGNGQTGFRDGIGTDAQFSQPKGVDVDAQGNVYVADTDYDSVRKITPGGAVTTLAGGSGYQGDKDGLGLQAQFAGPNDVAVDAQGNVYVTDSYNNKIRKVTPAGSVTTLAGGTKDTEGFTDGTGVAARFDFPRGIAVDTDGNVYVGDTSNNRIRKITPAGAVTTLAGSTQGFADGTGAAAKFDRPWGLTVDGQGNVYVADFGNDRIRKITPSGEVTTLAEYSTKGDFYGTIRDGLIWQPVDVDVDEQGNLYVTSYRNEFLIKIRKE